MTQLVDEEDDDLDKTKCVCYIHLAEYDKAITIAKKLDLTFEHAYCCYRLNQVAGGFAHQTPAAGHNTATR